MNEENLDSSCDFQGPTLSCRTFIFLEVSRRSLRFPRTPRS
jgi:hypothetical protein